MNTKIKQHCILYCEFFMVYKHTGSFESYIGLGIIFFPLQSLLFEGFDQDHSRVCLCSSELLLVTLI